MQTPRQTHELKAQGCLKVEVHRGDRERSLVSLSEEQGIPTCQAQPEPTAAEVQSFTCALHLRDLGAAGDGTRRDQGWGYRRPPWLQAFPPRSAECCCHTHIPQTGTRGKVRDAEFQGSSKSHSGTSSHCLRQTRLMTHPCKGASSHPGGHISNNNRKKNKAFNG